MNFQESQHQTEQARIPYSFWIFVLNIGVVIFAFILSAALAGIGVSNKYATAVAAPILIGISLLTSGIYAGFTHTSIDQRRVRLNKIGLWGNSILYGIVLLGISAYAISRALL